MQNFAKISKNMYQNIEKMCSKVLNGPYNFVLGQKSLPRDNCSTLQNINPASGQKLFDFPCSGKLEVERVVEVAYNTFKSWSSVSNRIRGQFLLTAANNIRSRLEEIAMLEVLDTGKPIWEARVDIDGCADVLEYYGGIAASIKGDHYNLENDNFAFVRREPLGVVAGIGAWNYPFQSMAWKVAPALACGNTFIYKPSQFTPITSIIFAEILTEVGIPPGVVNVVQGDGITGKLLCAHPNISKVTFTGSVETGKHIMKNCADGMKKVTLELGGKSALIVFADCDIINSVKATLLGNFLTQGEVCTNCTRVFVEESILGKFQDLLVSATKKLVIGDPRCEKTMVGAMINSDHGEKVLKYIRQAKMEGANVLCGGDKIQLEGELSNGCYIPPCVLSNCNNEMTAVKEEIFGPVVCLLPFKDEKEAITQANASPYGLAAGVMTKDLKRAHRVASNLQAGIVWINNYNVFPPEVPFGGYKMSGLGRENGLAAINEFTQLKTVYVEMNDEIECPIYVQ